jgi:hypothetical protein
VLSLVRAFAVEKYPAQLRKLEAASPVPMLDR